LVALDSNTSAGLAEQETKRKIFFDSDAKKILHASASSPIVPEWLPMTAAKDKDERQ
jgi:hypothetical protein